MKHYLKNTENIGYTRYIFIDVENIRILDFSTTKSIDWSDNFCDKEDIYNYFKNLLKKGCIPIERKEFNNAFIEVSKELNEIIKEL